MLALCSSGEAKLFGIVMVTRLAGHCAKEVPVGDALLGRLAEKSCLLTGLKHSSGCVIVYLRMACKCDIYHHDTLCSKSSVYQCLYNRSSTPLSTSLYSVGSACMLRTIYQTDKRTKHEKRPCCSREKRY